MAHPHPSLKPHKEDGLGEVRAVTHRSVKIHRQTVDGQYPTVKIHHQTVDKAKSQAIKTDSEKTLQAVSIDLDQSRHKTFCRDTGR
jgi:uncharacterized protein YjdB